MTQRVPYLANGVQRGSGGADFEVRSPWSGEVVAVVATPSVGDVDGIVRAAKASLKDTERLDRSHRAGILDSLADAVASRAEEFARILTAETGKTIRDARAEVDRAVSTLRFGAHAALELRGEVLGLDALAGIGERIAYTVRRPIGVVAALPASNYPLLLAAHKIAPAIGAGCPVILKPSEKTPLSALLLAELLLETPWPAAAVSVLVGGGDIGRALTTHEDIRLVTFTGSSPVGHAIAQQTGAVRLMLELGSNAPTIVLDDADLDLLIDRCMVGAFTSNGQSCISVQRLLVHESVYAEVVERLTARIRLLVLGDPSDERTDVGPVIDDASAARIEALIDDARRHGGTVEVGGGRNGRLIEPTLIAGLNDDMALQRDEVFGPVVLVGAFSTIDEAIEIANGTPYGLQAGVFTNRLDVALELAQRLEFGGVHINEISTFRPDHMPYGGVKASGLGKEGPAAMMREMTEEKVVSIRPRPQRKDIP